MMTCFDTIAKKSYAYSENEQASYEWRLVKSLYELNYLNNIDKIQRLPKKIHQIWLGSQFPKQYWKYAESWQQLHPDWEYKLWTDKNLKDIDLIQWLAFKKATNYGMKSDILRYEILQQFGGLYIDTDFECLKPFDSLTNLEFFTGIGFDAKLQLYNGLIASIPNHPIIKDTVALLGNNYFGHRGGKILNTTGANHFTRTFFLNVNIESKNVVAFPTDYFYPFPNNVRGIDNPYKFVQDNSFAIHHWAVSWIKKI